MRGDLDEDEDDDEDDDVVYCPVCGCLLDQEPHDDDCPYDGDEDDAADNLDGL